MGIKAKVENMVSAITLDQRINLKELANKAKGLEYNPKRFPGIVYRLKPPDPKLAMLIFTSGKVICTGARSREDIKAAVNALRKKLKEGGVTIRKEPEVKIQNIVASAKLDLRVNLDMLAMECENTEYEPEQFPGLVFRLDEPETVMLIFRSGKIIITGAKKPQEADIAAEKTKQKVKEVGAIIK